MADHTEEKKPAVKTAKARRKPEDAAQGSGLGLGPWATFRAS